MSKTREKILKQGKDIQDNIGKYLNLKEEQDWEKKKSYYKLNQDTKPTLADMVKNNYINMLRETNLPLSPNLLYLAKDLDMFKYIESKTDLSMIHGGLDGLYRHIILNDRDDIFKYMTDTELYLDIIMLFAPSKILKYVISKVSSETISEFFIRYIYSIPRSLRDLFTYTNEMRQAINKYRPNYLNDDIDIKEPTDDFDKLLSLVEADTDPTTLIQNMEGEIKEEVVNLARYLILTKNKYFFKLYDYILKERKDIIKSLSKEAFQLAWLTNDYILAKRLDLNSIDKKKFEIQDFYSRLI